MRPSAHGAFAFRFACRSIPETQPFPLLTPNSHPPNSALLFTTGLFFIDFVPQIIDYHYSKQGVSCTRRGLRVFCLFF